MEPDGGTALVRREAAAELQARPPRRGPGSAAGEGNRRRRGAAGRRARRPRRCDRGAVGPGVVVLGDGDRLRAHAVVVAAAGLVDDAPDGWHALSCSWFDAPQPPLPGAWLVLGDGDGPITTLCSVSEVAPEYAPPGRALVAVATASGRPRRGRHRRAARALVRPRRSAPGATCARTSSRLRCRPGRRARR